MNIDSPFMLEREPNENDEHYFSRAMVCGDAGNGGFPVSLEVNWHGGAHVNAPLANGNALSVRAVADGTVVFVRSATAFSNDSEHPLSYDDRWTDDGCVVIRHELPIGSDVDTGSIPTVVFYSVTMHLSSVANSVQQGQSITRGTVLGRPGRIFGDADRVHLEILCDDDNVEAITGRSHTETYLPVDHDGRTNCVFGTIWYFVLIDAPFYDRPRDGNTPEPTVLYTLERAMIIGMRYRGDRCVTQTYNLGGTPVGDPIDEPIPSASARYPESAPQAGYEMLRYGRMFDSQTLNPADAPHWRKVVFERPDHAAQIGWINLSSQVNGRPIARKFSDADFPHWDHWWMLVDGSSSTDSRCRSIEVTQLLDINDDLIASPKEAQEALNDPNIQERLNHKICKYATEWDPATIDQRYSWLTTEGTPPMTADEYNRFKEHARALCFWDEATIGLSGTHWHFHPRTFIRHLGQVSKMPTLRTEIHQPVTTAAMATEASTAIDLDSIESILPSWHMDGAAPYLAPAQSPGHFVAKKLIALRQAVEPAAPPPPESDFDTRFYFTHPLITRHFPVPILTSVPAPSGTAWYNEHGQAQPFLGLRGDFRDAGFQNFLAAVNKRLVRQWMGELKYVVPKEQHRTLRDWFAGADGQKHFRRWCQLIDFHRDYRSTGTSAHHNGKGIDINYSYNPWCPVLDWQGNRTVGETITNPHPPPASIQPPAGTYDSTAIVYDRALRLFVAAQGATPNDQATYFGLEYYRVRDNWRVNTIESVYRNYQIFNWALVFYFDLYYNRAGYPKYLCSYTVHDDQNHAPPAGRYNNCDVSCGQSNQANLRTCPHRVAQPARRTPDQIWQLLTNDVGAGNLPPTSTFWCDPAHVPNAVLAHFNEIHVTYPFGAARIMQAFPLNSGHMSTVPEDHRAGVVNALASQIEADHRTMRPIISQRDPCRGVFNHEFDYSIAYGRMLTDAQARQVRMFGNFGAQSGGDFQHFDYDFSNRR